MMATAIGPQKTFRVRGIIAGIAARAVSTTGRVLRMVAPITASQAEIPSRRSCEIWSTRMTLLRMALAPLLGPNVGLSLAATLGDLKLAKESLKSLLAGIVVVLALSAAAGPIVGFPESSNQFMSRTQVNYADVILAVVSGAAAIISFTGVIPASLVGVMRSLEMLKILGVAAEKPSAFLPGVPTLREQGFDIVSDIRRGFVAPKGLDPAALAFLRQAFKKIALDPEYQAEMRKAGQPAEYLSGEEFEAYVRKQFEIDKALLVQFGLLKK